MLQLTSGHFFGDTGYKIHADGLILTNTNYTHDFVDWHHHENAYFTFILSGNVIEGSKKGKLHLGAGNLLFHHAQEPHYNVKPKGKTRGMHLEVEQNWMTEMQRFAQQTEGSFEVKSPKTKILFYRILQESLMADDLTMLGVQQLAIAAMDSLFMAKPTSAFQPPWVKMVAENLNDNYLHIPQLRDLAALVGIHPVHLSRSFAKYFGCTMAEYVRQLKVARAMSQLGDSQRSLSAIAHASGFADQSHMVRCIKAQGGCTPAVFRKLITC